MPYQFQTTFTEPLLADLDGGKLSDARSWANAITTYYLNTIKQGLPNGVPPVLPAPGLNPMVPPPFTIGASPFLTADSKRDAFYNIVYAYFKAKELNLQKGSIQQSLLIAKQLVRKAKKVSRQIKSTKEQLRNAEQQLKELPSLIQDVNDGVKELVADQVNDTRRLIDSFREYEYESNTDQIDFEQTFSSELSTIDTISKFSITDKAGVVKLTRFVAEQNDATDRFIESPRREQLVKAQLNRRLLKVAKELLSYVEIPFKPNLFIDYVNNLEKRSAKFVRFARAVKRIGFINRFILTKVQKLKLKVVALVNKLRNKIQAKILQIQQKIKKDRADYDSNKQESKQKGLFKKAKKTLTEARKLNNRVIKQQTNRVKTAKKLIKRSVAASTKLVGLYTSIEGEFAQLRQDLESQKGRVAQLGSNVQTLTNTQYDQNTESNRLREYFNDAGLSAFANAAVQVLVQTQSSARDVINLVERRSDRYKRYGQEIEQLGEDVSSIQRDINSLHSRKRNNKPVREPGQKSWVGERLASIKSLLERIVKWLKPKIQKIVAWLRKLVKRVTQYINSKLKKYGEALETFAINLIPFTSVSKDGLTKKEVAQAKKRLLKDKVIKLKSKAKKLRTLAPALPASMKIANNLKQGKFRLSDNQANITKLTNALFNTKRDGKSAAQQRAIGEDKKRFTSNFNTLIIVESILTSVSLISETIKQEAKSEFDTMFRDLKRVTAPTQLQTIVGLEQLLSQPPSKLSEIESAANVVSQDVVNDVAVTNRLVDFEKKRLRRVRQLLSSITEQSSIKGKYEQMNQEGKTSGLFFTAYKELKGISDYLGKQQSFTLKLLKLLGKLVKMFMQWLKQTVQKAISSVTERLTKEGNKAKKQTEKEIKTSQSRRPNADAAGMSVAFGLAARLFWTGASWVGPTGTNHTCISIGRFKKMKAKTEDGASAFVRQLATGFQRQLIQMQGMISPPPPTAIAPFSFKGYI